MDPNIPGTDVPSEVLQETQARFIQRDPEREACLERLKTGGPLAAESPERVEARLTRLGVPFRRERRPFHGRPGWEHES